MVAAAQKVLIAHGNQPIEHLRGRGREARRLHPLHIAAGAGGNVPPGLHGQIALVGVPVADHRRLGAHDPVVGRRVHQHLGRSLHGRSQRRDRAAVGQKAVQHFPHDQMRIPLAMGAALHAPPKGRQRPVLAVCIHPHVDHGLHAAIHAVLIGGPVMAPQHLVQPAIARGVALRVVRGDHLLLLAKGRLRLMLQHRLHKGFVPAIGVHGGLQLSAAHPHGLEPGAAAVPVGAVVVKGKVYAIFHGADFRPFPGRDLGGELRLAILADLPDHLACAALRDPREILHQQAREFIIRRGRVHKQQGKLLCLGLCFLCRDFGRHSRGHVALRHLRHVQLGQASGVERLVFHAPLDLPAHAHGAQGRFGGCYVVGQPPELDPPVTAQRILEVPQQQGLPAGGIRRGAPARRALYLRLRKRHHAHQHIFIHQRIAPAYALVAGAIERVGFYAIGIGIHQAIGRLVFPFAMPCFAHVHIALKALAGTAGGFAGALLQELQGFGVQRRVSPIARDQLQRRGLVRGDLHPEPSASNTSCQEAPGARVQRRGLGVGIVGSGN